MKHKLITVAIGILAGFFLIGLCSDGSAGQNPQWKGKIDTVDGVKVVRNPNEPLFGDIKLDLEEDLKIGREDDEKYLFYKVRDLAVDLRGDIYVADMGNARVQKFDSRGKYLITFGRKGQGPGEFDWPSIVRIDENSGNVLVKDGPVVIEVFDREAKPIRSVRLEHVFYDFKIVLDGSILAGIFDSGLQPIHSLCKIDSQGKVELKYADGLYTMYVEKKAEGGTFAFGTGHELDLLFNPLNASSIVYGYSKEYELTVAGFDSRIRYRMNKDEPYPKFTAAEKKDYKRIALPEFKPYFYSLFTDDLGRIYVQRNITWGVKKDVEKEIDVFSQEGYFLYRTKLPKEAYVIRNGYIYALETKDDEIVKRFKIKNWGTLKSGL